MVRIARYTKRYLSDLTDEEWERIAPLMPAPGRRGPSREIEIHEIVNVMHYLVPVGCG
ncbi:MAG: transposase [Janthinobacterium lividum]